MNTGFAQDTIPLRSPEAPQRAPVPVLRYTDIACSRRVWIETPRIPVVARLTVQRPAYSAAVQELTLDPTQTVRVSLQALGFILPGLTVQPIAIAADTDSAPVVFDLRLEKVGHTSLTFDFFQGNEPVGTAVIAVEITAYDVIEGAAPAPVRPLAFGKNVEPPDVVLHIAVEESPLSLLFSLIRDGSAWWKTFPTVRIRPLPETFAARLYRSITSLAGSDDPVVKAVLGRRLSIPPDDVDRSVKNLGRNLWKSLIPDDLKALYAAERDDWAGKTRSSRTSRTCPGSWSGSTMTAVGGATSSPGAAP